MFVAPFLFLLVVAVLIVSAVSGGSKRLIGRLTAQPCQSRLLAAARGRMRNWWTATDDAHFAVKAAQLVVLYSGCETALGLRVDGLTGDQRFFLGFAKLRRGQR
jgi:putative endopeptidase